MTESKYRSALEFLGEKSKFPIKFELKDETEELIRLSVTALRPSKIDVIIPYADELQLMLPANLPRDMRHAQIPFKLIKVLAFLHQYQRVRLLIKGIDSYREYVIAEPQDCIEAMQICNEIIETTRLGTTVESVWFFENVIKPLCDKQSGVSMKQLIQRYYSLKHELIGHSTLKTRFLNPLAYAGLICYEINPNDRREKLVFVSEIQEKITKHGFLAFSV